MAGNFDCVCRTCCNLSKSFNICLSHQRENTFDFKWTFFLANKDFFGILETNIFLSFKAINYFFLMGCNLMIFCFLIFNKKNFFNFFLMFSTRQTF